MADHAGPVRTEATGPGRDAAHGVAGSLPAPALQAVAQRLNDAPRVASLRRDAERLNDGRGTGTLQRAARPPLSATFTPPDTAVENAQPIGIATAGTVQGLFYLHQTQEFSNGISDLHYRYDDDIDGNAQAGEHLHITVTYQPPPPPPPPAVAGGPAPAPAAAPPARTRHCYYNYNDQSWRWDNAPPANITGVVDVYKDFAIGWAAGYRPDDDDDDDGEQEVPDFENEDDFPLPGR